jgi:hypothetical protein
MRKKFPIVQIGGLSINGTWLAVVCSLLLWGLFVLLGIFVFDLAVWTAVWGGLIATLLHWLAALLHHGGHAVAARRTGYPMREIRLLHLLATSIYPRHEPDLPAEIHIRRALGGPAASFLAGLVGFGLAWLLQSNEPAYLLALFFALENLLVFGLGAFIPLGFTDGSTLLEWWPRRGDSG